MSKMIYTPSYDKVGVGYKSLCESRERRGAGCVLSRELV